uniref:Uncharacterized protein n=1 Tax=Anguilla anguilla TaxID=7936 RepID=A0A0E9URU8_ANGAN
MQFCKHKLELILNFNPGIDYHLYVQIKAFVISIDKKSSFWLFCDSLIQLKCV